MVTRPTAEVPLTLDAKPVERQRWKALADEERRLVVERERAVKSKRAPITKKINTVRAEMDDLARDIASGQITVTVEGLPRGKYRALLTAHPPKDGDKIDERVGYNMDTLGADLLRAATTTAVNGDGDTVPLDVDAWVDDETGVAAGDFERWFRTALAQQTQPVDVSPPLRSA